MKFILCIITILAMTTPSLAKNIQLTKDNSISLRSEVTDASIAKLQLGLSELVQKRGTKSYTIYLVLNSPGGSIDAGLAFIEFAKTIPNLETITLFSASMAAGIVEALPGKRNILETGVLMFHRARGGVQGQFEDGELESRLGFYKRLVRSMEVANASRMSLTLDAYKAKVKDELWILGSDAVTSKAADEIVTVTCAKELLDSQIKESMVVMGLFKITVVMNGCPLIRTGTVENPNDNTIYTKYRQQAYKVGN